jgi:hypothetical protein
VEQFNESDVVRFAGPGREGDFWPRPSELGVIEAVYDEAVVVTWEIACGSAAWPLGWLRLVETVS